MKKIIIWFLGTSLALNVCKSNAQQKQKMMSATHTITKQTLLSSEEREYAVKFLKETGAGVFNSIEGLNRAQLTFKPAADKWSVEDCVKHLAAAEETLWKMAEESLKQPANREKRKEIKFTDAELIRAVEDRSQKSKTFAALEPENSPYTTMPAALASFKENREKLIVFIKNTKEDLRNHVSILPIGIYDAYQFILLISAHSNRHTQQIEEVKAAIDFPKK